MQTTADARELSNHFSLFVFIVSFVPLFTHLLSLNNTYNDFKNREYGGGPRGKSGTAIEHVKELLEHVNCEYSGLACEEMHLDFVYCVRKACALGKKNVLGRVGAYPHTAVLASG